MNIPRTHESQRIRCGFKLFRETTEGSPRTLVHGMPIGPGDTRTRNLPLRTWFIAEEGTVGFNLFTTKEDAISYWYKRFPVNAPHLVLSPILALLPSNMTYTSNRYVHASAIYIPFTWWEERIDWDTAKRLYRSTALLYSDPPSSSSYHLSRSSYG